MKTRTVLDGNAFYEIDEDCMKKKEKKREMETNGKRNRTVSPNTGNARRSQNS